MMAGYDPDHLSCSDRHLWERKVNNWYLHFFISFYTVSGKVGEGWGCSDHIFFNPLKSEVTISREDRPKYETIFSNNFPVLSIIISVTRKIFFFTFQVVRTCFFRTKNQLRKSSFTPPFPNLIGRTYYSNVFDWSSYRRTEIFKHIR